MRLRQLAGLLGEQDEHVELRRGQVHRPARDDDPVARGVDLHVARGATCRRGSARAGRACAPGPASIDRPARSGTRDRRPEKSRSSGQPRTITPRRRSAYFSGRATSAPPPRIVGTLRTGERASASASERRNVGLRAYATRAIRPGASRATDESRRRASSVSPTSCTRRSSSPSSAASATTAARASTAVMAPLIATSAISLTVSGRASVAAAHCNERRSGRESRGPGSVDRGDRARGRHPVARKRCLHANQDTKCFDRLSSKRMLVIGKLSDIETRKLLVSPARRAKRDTRPTNATPRAARGWEGRGDAKDPEPGRSPHHDRRR